MNKNQKILSFLPTGALGIDRMAVGCYKTGAAKLLSSLFLWLTPIPYMWWGTDVAASFLDEKYIQDYSTKFHELLKVIKKSKGPILIYSYYVWSGVIPLALFLIFTVVST